MKDPWKWTIVWEVTMELGGRVEGNEGGKTGTTVTA